MFKDIKLDDRTYDEIRNDVIENIIKHCPEWTNHNPSDPGITLIELFAYMTEMTQYRLNQVPAKNYLAFLDLLGMKQRLSLAAQSRVCFDLSVGYQMDAASKDTVLIPKNTKVATLSDEENEEIIFETSKALYASNVKLLNLYSKTYDASRDKSKIFDYTNNIENKEAFYPFSKNGNSENIVDLIFYSEDFYVLKNDIKMTMIFRLPTTMREYDIGEDFLSKMNWQYFDGTSWHRLKIAYDLSIALDDTDADILSVTFEGNCENLQKDLIDELNVRENFFIKASFQEIPTWLEEFSAYEISVVTNSNPEGLLPDDCFYNYELLDLNNSFFPFGTRPTLDATTIEEIFYIQCNQAFCEVGTSVEINFDLAKLPGKSLPQGYNSLQIIYEYSVGEAKWAHLDVRDNTFNFTQQGVVSFTIPSDFKSVVLNAKDGFWLRAKIASGNYGLEEENIFDNQTSELKTIAATLNPPIISSIDIRYSHQRKDLPECYSLNNYQYENIKFDKNRPVFLFKNEYVKEDAIFLGFDSYLSEQILELYFDIDLSQKQNDQQRVIEWEILINGVWERLKVEDYTKGLSTSGDVKITLPKIENLEAYSLYLENFERMWIKIKVKFNALKISPKINQVLLNNVIVEQKETYYEEMIAYSSGLPDMQFKLQHKNLIGAPLLKVGELEYKAVERFIDYGANDNVFRFNGINGDLEFGDGKYGNVPPLGAEIIAVKYEVTKGGKGNLAKGKIRVLKDSINYMDNVSNIFIAKNGQNGDTIEDVKRLAPNTLNTMKRAVTVDDYEHLTLAYSPYIKKAKCLFRDGQILILIMSSDILRDKGFINLSFIDKLEDYLKTVSMVTLIPRVQSVNIVDLKIRLKLKYTDDTEVPNRSLLENEILENTKRYLDPFVGVNNSGYEIGRTLLKSDIVRIVNNSTSSLVISEMSFIKDGVALDDNKVNLSYNEILDLKDLVIEELNYDF